MTAGLLNQIPPHWSSVRWRHISPRALAELPRKELAVVDQIYRDLERIGDLVSTHVTLSAEEKKYLDDGGHFWPGRYADIRKDTYARLERVVTSVLGAANPLKGRVDYTTARITGNVGVMWNDSLPCASRRAASAAAGSVARAKIKPR